MSVLNIFIKLIAVFDLLVIAVYFGGDILSTMLNKLRRTPKQDDPFDFSLDTVTVSLSIDSIRQLYSGDAADFDMYWTGHIFLNMRVILVMFRKMSV